MNNIKVEKLTDLHFEGLSILDPDNSEAYLSAAKFEGRDLTEEELEWIKVENETWFTITLYQYLV